MYLAIKQYTEIELIINKSRFIAQINRAETEEEALEFIKQIKKKHYNATHNCSCYIIGPDKMIQKQNDDGEPSGTAGIPMIEVLRKNNLTDTVVVVTRYFGGIKLGASGLIRAYSQAVSEAIKASGIIEKKLMRLIDVHFDYSLIGLLEHKLSSYEVINRTYLEKVCFTYRIDEDKVQAFLAYLIDLTNNNIKYELKDFTLCEVDYLGTLSA
ncbi:MAG: YigZ family protein [Bacilli bacterium]|nr:YigZ family protein [Bacilli bacterium]